MTKRERQMSEEIPTEILAKHSKVKGLLEALEQVEKEILPRLKSEGWAPLYRGLKSALRDWGKDGG